MSTSPRFLFRLLGAVACGDDGAAAIDAPPGAIDAMADAPIDAPPGARWSRSSRHVASCQRRASS